MSKFFQVFRVLFAVFLIAFLVGGAVIVLVQALGVVVLSESIVTGATENLAPWVFSAATLCAVSAFILRYSSGAKAEDID